MPNKLFPSEMKFKTFYGFLVVGRELGAKVFCVHFCAGYTCIDSTTFGVNVFAQQGILWQMIAVTCFGLSGMGGDFPNRYVKPHFN